MRLTDLRKEEKWKESNKRTDLIEIVRCLMTYQSGKEEKEKENGSDEE